MRAPSTTVAAASEVLSALADPVRLRLVALLARQELSVAEVQEALDLAQSRASTHLALLRDAGLVRARREGRSALYAADLDAMPASARSLWEALSGSLDDQLLSSDARRAEALVKRRTGTGAWTDSVAGEMERHYSPGRTWEAAARGLLGLTRHGDVLDVGSGDGALAALLAPVSCSVTLLDASPRMVEAARRRLEGIASAEVVCGDAHELPFPDGSFDVVMLFNLLASVEEPARVLEQAARVLRAGGRVAVVTLARHEQLEVTARYGHRRPGFRPVELGALLRGAGLEVELCEITSRERREPHFDVLTAFAQKPSRRKSVLPPTRKSTPPRRASVAPPRKPTLPKPPHDKPPHDPRGNRT